MLCPICDNAIQLPGGFFASRIAPWHCSYCSGLFVVDSGQNQAFAIPDDFRPLAPLLSLEAATQFCHYARDASYVYAICTREGIPLYVGSGVAMRAVSHVIETARLVRTKKPMSEKNREIAHECQIPERGVWFHFPALCKSRQRAYEIESHYIAKLGVRSKGGLLTNLDGLPAKPRQPENEDRPTGFEFDEAVHDIKTFGRPGYVPLDPLTQGWKTKPVQCTSCGYQGTVTVKHEGQYTVCPRCGHFTFGIHGRERCPLKFYEMEDLIWHYEVKPPKDW